MKTIFRVILMLIVLATSGLFSVTLKDGTVLFAGDLPMLIGSGFMLLYLKEGVE